jgi:hypothetical protein
VLLDNFETFCLAFQNEIYPQAFTQEPKLQQISTGPTTDKTNQHPYEYYIARVFCFKSNALDLVLLTITPLGQVM